MLNLNKSPLQTNIFTKYSDGTPLSYQVWNHYLIKNKNYRFSFLSTLSDSMMINKNLKLFQDKMKIAQRKMQPELLSDESCVVMLTVVLTEPDWIIVPCVEKITNLILCEKILNTTSAMSQRSVVNYGNGNKRVYCKQGQFFISGQCILFKYFKKLSDLNYKYKNKGKFAKKYFNQTIKKLFHDYFSLIQQFYFQPLQFTLHFTSNDTFVTFKGIKSSEYKELHWINDSHVGGYIPQHDGYMLHPVISSQIIFFLNLFYCSDGAYIDATLVCNGIKDCITATDEKGCICQHQSYSSFCKYHHRNNTNDYTCSDFYYQCSNFKVCIPSLLVCNGHIDCPQGGDEFCIDNSKKQNKDIDMLKTDFFICNRSGKIISLNFVDDLIPDCPNSFEDEEQYYNLLTNPSHKEISCSKSDEIPCIPGHSHCFPFEKLCVYDIQDNSSQLKYCRNGVHLKKCKNFHCFKTFKCPSSYCVDISLVCNGIWDCPLGHDEHNCTLYICAHLFKCKLQSKCLHLSKVCDRSKDCINGDDELSCVTNLPFPSKCVCFSQSIICDHLKNIQIYRYIWPSIKYFKCNNCSLQFHNVHFSVFGNTKFLHIREDFHPYICINKNKNNPILASLEELDCSSNRLILIKSSCFSSLKSLVVLNFQNNSIFIIEDKSFSNLFNLSILNLSKNRISILRNNLFSDLPNIQVINLTHNFITIVSSDIFKHLPSHAVHSFNGRVCCMSGLWSKCKLRTDVFPNCHDLLPSTVLNYLCSLVGILSVCFNFISALIHIKSFNELLPYDLFTFSLSFIDSLFRIYLLTISVADWYFKDII